MSSKLYKLGNFPKGSDGEDDGGTRQRHEKPRGKKGRGKKSRKAKGRY